MVGSTGAPPAPSPGDQSASSSSGDAIASAVSAAREAALGKELYEAVRTARLLVVGAGGIGCELLKDLVLTGFENIEVIDLDTIDVSNLNRQFLFRAKHVGQPKAVVARDVVLKLNPKARIIAHHDNIKAVRFGLDYFKTFTMVLNALDNLDARRHVNRMCLATGKPMIDAGTTGYVGQVNVMKKGEAACYECYAKPTQKVYPICTIRSTPDKPVHCVVWAKEAFRLLFGQSDSSMLYEAPDAPEPSAYMPIINARPVTSDSDTPDKDRRQAVLSYAANVIKALFTDEIERKVSKGLYSKAPSVPVPTKADPHTIADKLATPHTEGDGSGGGRDWAQRVWSNEESITHMLKCFEEAYLSPSRSSHLGCLEFDKDDSMAMRFVTAATNLRARTFGIQPQSYHDAKGIAGNIVPAIATTNAMAAALQVLEALKLLRKPDATIIEAGCRQTYIVREGAGRKRLLLQPGELEPQAPRCFVCNKSDVDVLIDTSKATLRDFVDKVLKGRLSFSEPSISVGVSMLYEEGDGADEQLAKNNLDTTLQRLPAGGIVDQSTVEVEDFSQDLTLHIHVYHRDSSWFDPDQAPEGFMLGAGANDALARAQAKAAQEKASTEAAADEDDVEVEVEEVGNGNGNGHDKGKGTKRAREDEDDGEPPSKKPAPSSAEPEVVSILDDDDNMVVID